MDAFYHTLSTNSWSDLPQERVFAVHQWIDASKSAHADFRHRALRHHKEAARDVCDLFGAQYVPVLYQHVYEDLNHLPTLSDWLAHLTPPSWFRCESPEALAEYSARKFGGRPADYISFHQWVNRYESVHPLGNFASHHTFGTQVALAVYGAYLTNSKGAKVPIISLFEYHLRKTYRFLPTLSHWLVHLKCQKWMYPESKLLFKRFVPHECSV